VRTRIYLARADVWEGVGRAHGEIFADVRPANTTVVAPMIDPRWLVEIEADALLPA
jgi:enamine deaminase RidA (YjgF/YER057c/UK114 family)